MILKQMMQKLVSWGVNVRNSAWEFALLDENRTKLMMVLPPEEFAQIEKMIETEQNSIYLKIEYYDMALKLAIQGVDLSKAKTWRDIEKLYNVDYVKMCFGG